MYNVSRNMIIECLFLKCLKEDLMMYFLKINLKFRYKIFGKMIYN